MYVERHVVAVTTDGAGDAEAFTPVVTGRVLAIHYVKTDFADGVDFTVTAEATGETIWSESDVNASARRAAVNGPMALAKDRVKIVVGSGGANKTGTFHVVVG